VRTLLIPVFLFLAAFGFAFPVLAQTPPSSEDERIVTVQELDPTPPAAPVQGSLLAPRLQLVNGSWVLTTPEIGPTEWEWGIREGTNGNIQWHCRVSGQSPDGTATAVRRQAEILEGRPVIPVDPLAGFPNAETRANQGLTLVGIGGHPGPRREPGNSLGGNIDSCVQTGANLFLLQNPVTTQGAQ
jgi:hypothetical protein